MAKLNYIAYNNQNILDFVISNYGTIDKLFTFIKDANLNSYSDFNSFEKKTYQLDEIVGNSVTQYYRDNRIVVASTDVNQFQSDLICNNDLTFKTLVTGDFNDDFNNDFSRTSLDTIIVGYEGMDLYVLFSVNNNGNKIGNASGTVTLSGVETKNFSQDIRAGETHQFQVIFNDVQSGVYDVIVEGGCTQTKSIEVLGNVNFVCNNNLSIHESAPYNQGDIITFEWSVDNTGSTNGLYNGTWSMIKNDNQIDNQLSTIIDSNSTYSFIQSYTLDEAGTYQIISSCGQKINFDVNAVVSESDIVYNNDLQILESSIKDGDNITVQWSMTNNGTTSGTTNGYVRYTPDFKDNNTKWAENDVEIGGGKTQIFTKNFIVSGGDKSIVLTGDAIDTLNFTVLTTTIFPEAFWVDVDGISPYIAQCDQPPYNTTMNQVAFFHARLANTTGSQKTVRVKMVWNGRFTFYDKDVTLEDNTNITPTYGLGTDYKLDNIPVDLYIDGVFRSRVFYNIK